MVYDISENHYDSYLERKERGWSDEEGGSWKSPTFLTCLLLRHIFVLHVSKMESEKAATAAVKRSRGWIGIREP